MGEAQLTISNVLQMNVRLSEGGAAGVARTLADELTRRGINSPFAYGYSKGGRASPLEERYSGIRVTPAPIAATNRVSYSLFGRDTRLTAPANWTRLREAIALSDVVHLHAVHSYIVDTGKLVDEIIRAGKPVVWTLHDQWLMTGRCAQPGSCRLWEIGCPKCPNLEAYPPARVDHTARRFNDRRAIVDRLQSSVPTELVACADWLGAEAKLASLKNVSIVKNSVDREFWESSTFKKGEVGTEASEARNLFMCRDLRDQQKVDWALLRAVSSIEGQSLTIVGNDAPFELKEARRVPAIASRTELAQVMRDHDRLIFTSQVDYFPLTIVEALTCGLEVLAIDSLAAREFAGNPLLTIFDTTAELLAHTRERPSVRTPEGADDLDRQSFAPDRMTENYLAIYERLTGA